MSPVSWIPKNSTRCSGTSSASGPQSSPGSSFSALPFEDRSSIRGPIVALEGGITYSQAAMIEPLLLLAAAIGLSSPAVSTSAPQQEPEGEQPAEPETPAGVVIELALEDALRLALGSNLGLEIETLNTRTAHYDERGSWGAFDWVVTVTGRYTDGEQPGSSQLSGASVLEFDTQGLNVDLSKPLTTGGDFSVRFDRSNTETNNQFSLVNPSTTDNLTVAYNQPLLRGLLGGAPTSTQRTSDVRFRQQLEREREVRQQLLRDVTDAYWNLVDMNEQLIVAESNLELGREQLDLNRRRLEGEVGTEVEVIQAEAEVATRIESQLLVRVRLRDAMDALKVLLFNGTDKGLWEAVLDPTDLLPELEIVNQYSAPAWTECLYTAIENRGNLRRQRLEIEVAEIGLARAGSDRLVGLDLQLSASSQGFDGDSSESLNTTFSWDFPTYSAALVLNTPIQNRTAKYGERAARAGVRLQKLTYDSLELQVASEVRAAVREADYQTERVRAATESLRLASKQLEAEQARYREGLSTTFQVLEFQHDYALALSNERRSRVDYMKALSSLRHAQGVLGE